MADAATKQQNPETTKQEGPKGPARIQVTKIKLVDSEDLPGGNSLQWVIDCTAQTAPGRQFFVGYFIPAYQIIEVQWFKNEKTEPRVLRYPMCRVRMFE